MINVYCLDISLISDEHYKIFYAAASGERQEKADRCRFPADAKRCILADSLLKYGAAHFLKDEPRQTFQNINLQEERMPEKNFQEQGRFIQEHPCFSEKKLAGKWKEGLQIAQGPNGKPYVKNLDGFHYNLSHSGDWVVLAWGDSEVGVDVEQFRESTNLERTTRRFFTEEERTYIFAPAEEQERIRRFTKIWTCKESYVKYLGTGLAKSLESFSVDGEHDRLRLAGEENDKLRLAGEESDKLRLACGRDDVHERPEGDCASQCSVEKRHHAHCLSDKEAPMLCTWQLGERYSLALCCDQDEVCLKEAYWKELLNFL